MASSVDLRPSKRTHSTAGAEAIFGMLHEILGEQFGPIGLDGFLIEPSGQGFRHVASFGLRSGMEAMIDVDNVARQLEVRPQGRPLFIEVDTELSLLLQKLVIDGTVIGGFLLSGPRIGRDAISIVEKVARLATYALNLEQLSAATGMILDTLEKSDEPVSIYDDEDGIIFSNAAYHELFAHYPSQDAILGMSHIELYQLDLQAGVIDDETARNSPIAYLLNRMHLNRSLQGAFREIQRINGRTYIYSRTRADCGATLSRRTDITEIFGLLPEAQQTGDDPEASKDRD